MNHKEAYKALTSEQFSRRNEAWGQGWRINSEGCKVTMSNIKNGEKHVGYREMTKAMKLSKKVNWQD